MSVLPVSLLHLVRLLLSGRYTKRRLLLSLLLQAQMILGGRGYRECEHCEVL